MTGIFADGKMGAVAAAPSVAAAEPMTPCHAMVLEQPGGPLVARERPPPVAGPGQILIEVAACGVCRTDLHLLDGELPAIPLPIVPGHEIVGRVRALGDDVREPQLGQRVGVPWLGWTCGHCFFCRHGQENLCDNARFTGYQNDGGYASHCVADARYAFACPRVTATSRSRRCCAPD